MRFDLSGAQALASPTFASSNPGLEAINAIAGIRQAQADLTKTQIANQGQQSLLPGLGPQQQAQTGLYNAQAAQQNAQATIGIPAQAAQAMAEANIGIPDAGQQALAQAGLYNAQVSAGLPGAQASNLLASGVLSRAQAAQVGQLTSNPFINSTNPIIQYGAYLRYNAQHPQANSNAMNTQADSNNAGVPSAFTPGISLMPSTGSSQVNGSAQFPISNQSQQLWNQAQGASTQSLQNAQNAGMFSGAPMSIGSIVNPDGSINSQAYMSLLGQQATSGLGKTLAQTNFYNQRAGLPVTTTDANGNQVTTQPTSPSIVGPTQQREQAQSEFASIMTNYQRLISTYTGPTGAAQFATDILAAPGTPGFTRATNQLAGMDLQPDLSGLAAKVSLPGGGGETERMQYIHQLHTPIYSHVAQYASPQLQAAASALADNIRNSGLNVNVQQERQQFPISNVINQANNQISIPSFASKDQAYTWLRSLTPQDRADVRTQLAAKEGG